MKLELSLCVTLTVPLELPADYNRELDEVNDSKILNEAVGIAENKLVSKLEAALGPSADIGIDFSDVFE